MRHATKKFDPATTDGLWARRANNPEGSEPSASCGRLSEVSEWPRSKKWRAACNRIFFRAPQQGVGSRRRKLHCAAPPCAGEIRSIALLLLSARNPHRATMMTLSSGLRPRFLFLRRYTARANHTEATKKTPRLGCFFYWENRAW